MTKEKKVAVLQMPFTNVELEVLLDIIEEYRSNHVATAWYMKNHPEQGFTWKDIARAKLTEEVTFLATRRINDALKRFNLK